MRATELPGNRDTIFNYYKKDVGKIKPPAASISAAYRLDSLTQKRYYLILCPDRFLFLYNLYRDYGCCRIMIFPPRFSTDGCALLREMKSQKNTIIKLSSTGEYSVKRESHARSVLCLPKKRLIDLTVAVLILFVVLPTLIAITIAIVVTDGRPLLFVHRRVGRYGREFGCLKFRTMRRDSDQVLAAVLANDAAAREQWATKRKLWNDPRITRVGCFLRKYSLDELPQLLNVLKGEMSLVGPRPVTSDEIASYYVGASCKAYFSVRPGLTGLWQVAGRSNINFHERVVLDTTYVLNPSLRTDMIILLRTVAVVLRRKGAT